MTDYVLALWRDAADRWNELGDRIGFWRPVAGLPAWTAPAVALAGLLSLAIAAGLALASIATLLTALLIAHLVLTQVFGVAIDLAPLR